MRRKDSAYRYMVCIFCNKEYNVSILSTQDPETYVCPVCEHYMPTVPKKRKKKRRS